MSSFELKARYLTYTAAAPGIGQSPTYLVTERNSDGMSIELFYCRSHVKKDHFGRTVTDRAWKLTEYDRNDESMDEHWFLNFDDADAHASTLLAESYSHDDLLAGG